MVDSDSFETQRDMGCDVAGEVVAQLGAAGFDDVVEVGRGGFGVVYRATQVGLGRVVAVKVLEAGVDEDRARFAREQQAMARLTGHPNIVAVLQVGQTESGFPFLVMPYCGQGCWQERIARLGVLAVDEVLRVGVKIAGALASAHRLEVVHGDVKPANILLTDYGQAALSDFGIARVAGAFQSANGVLAGTPAFCAPELLGGQAISPASDVYGLAASLFAGATGHAAFERRRGEQVVAQFLRIAADPLPDAREYGVDDELAAVIQAAMVRAPGDRPTAIELGERLRVVQSRLGLAVDEMVLHGEGTADQRGGAVAGRAGRGNLPAPLTGLVGRGAEVARLRALLGESRLVTLSGVGGVGKTILAGHVAAELAATFAGGAWLVELGDLHDGLLLVEVVATALGVRDQSGRALSDVLVDVLGQRQALVVLDNCEHLIDEVAKLVEVLLRGCARLQILATSREVLGVGGEAVFTLPPLACPNADDEPSVEALGRYDAVRLFVERARAALPDFVLSGDNAAAVAGICARLEGLPLAIELASARLRAMSLTQIADGLADRYGLLGRGRRGAAQRQQTLAWCIGWSYQLCTAAEQQLWGRLSVFDGGFDLPAAQQVCAEDLGDDDLLDVLCALVDKSILIRTEHDDGQVRFRLLDTIRDYGRARITQGEYLHLQQCHGAWCRQLLAHAASQWWGPRQIWWLHRLTREMPNIREALQFNLTDNPAATLNMIAALRPMWVFAGMLGEGRRWVDQALSAAPPEPTTQRIRAICVAAAIAALQGDLSALRSRFDEARHHLDVMTDADVRGMIHMADSYIAMFGGEFGRAYDCLKRALAEAQDIELQVFLMMMLGWALQLSGDFHQALNWSEKALALAESRCESMLRALALLVVANCRWYLGEVQRAETLLRQSLQLSQPIKYIWCGALCLEMMAWVADSNDNPRRAVVLMAAADALSRATGASFMIINAIEDSHEACEHRAREELDAAEFDAAWDEGSSLTFDEAIAVAVAQTPGEP